MIKTFVTQGFTQGDCRNCNPDTGVVGLHLKKPVSRATLQVLSYSCTLTRITDCMMYVYWVNTFMHTLINYAVNVALLVAVF